MTWFEILAELADGDQRTWRYSSSDVAGLQANGLVTVTDSDGWFRSPVVSITDEGRRYLIAFPSPTGENTP